MIKKINAPALKIDNEMKTRFNRDVNIHGKIERRIIANLLNYIIHSGFVIEGIWDGEEFDKSSGIEDSMEFIFNLDECRIYVNGKKENGDKTSHNILIVLGNEPEDLISDWSYSEGDTDGFNACMEKFQPEHYV